MNKFTLLASSLALSVSALAADYPPNIDYGSQGDFLLKRAEIRGRTANLTPIGPVLANMPEGPGSFFYSTSDFRSTAWDLSNLLNPVEILDFEAWQPVGAHGTATRFDPEHGAMLWTGGNYLVFDENGGSSFDQLEFVEDTDGVVNPNAYSTMFSEYYTRTYWEYGFAPEGQYVIRNPANFIQTNAQTEAYFGRSENHPWLGEAIVGWDHYGLTGVTGFTSWLGNLLVVASDQQSTGIAIYDAAGFREGNVPRLLSTFNAEIVEPPRTGYNSQENRVGIGGYWVEPYGTTKMVWAARERSESTPSRTYPGMFVVDFEDPRNPRLSCAVLFDLDPVDPSDGDWTSDPMYVNFQDQYAYVDHFRVDIPACEAAYADGEISEQEFSEIVYRFDDFWLPGTDTPRGCDASQYFRPIGQVGIFGGYDWPGTDVLEQGMCFFVTSDEPDTRPPFISGHRPLAGQTNYPVDAYIHMHIPETLRSETLVDAIRVTNVDTGEEHPFRHQISHTGTLSVWPTRYFDTDATYRVSVTGVQDFMGNTMVPYSWTFSTGSSISPVDPTPTPAPTSTPAPTPSPTPGPNPTSVPNPTPVVTPAPTAVPTPNPTPNPTPVPPAPTPTPEPGPAPNYSGEAYFPIKSSQLACQPDEVMSGAVWVVNPDNDSVTIIDRELDPSDFALSLNVRREIKLNYQAPTSVTQVGANYVVTHRDDDKVVVYNAQGYPVRAIDTGHGTQPVASVYGNGSLYVSLYGSGEVVKINPASWQIRARLTVGPTPKAMAMLDTRLLVTRYISNGEYAEVYDIDATGNMRLDDTLRINKVRVPDDLDHGSGVPNYLSSIVITADGARAYVTANKANVDRGQQLNNRPLDADNTVRPMIAILDLINNRDANINPSTSRGTIDLDNGADPYGIIILPNPAIRVHALQGNNIVVANNLAANTSAQFPAGFAPQEMCTTMRTLYVKNFTERSVSAIDIAEFMHDGSRNPAVTKVTTVSQEKLTPEELQGLRIFYHSRMPDLSTEGYMSCASCHAEGGHDGQTWDISSMGEGLRNTISLNGAMGTRFGDLHWSGNFDEVQDFEIQIEGLNGASGLIPGTTFTGQSPLDYDTSNRSTDLDALAAYISSLGKDTVRRSPYRSYTGELTAAAQRGRAVFEANNCQSCHAGKAFRDGMTHDVGTIGPMSGQRLGGNLVSIRTPSLVQLWDSAPYFHDGSAATLNDVFAKGDHNVGMTPREQADLVAYLLSIDRELYIEDDELFIPGEGRATPTPAPTAAPTPAPTVAPTPAPTPNPTPNPTPAPAPRYDLNIANGSGDGIYPVGQVITIRADTAPSGQAFDYWTGDTANVADVEAATTTVTMPARELNITAVYQNVVVPDTQAPSTPNNLRATGTTANSISVAWNNASDNVGVVGYVIFLEGERYGSAAAGTSRTISPLNPASDYDIAVVAVDAAGNESSRSATINAVTSAAPVANSEARFYVFGHSLFNHGSLNAGYWLGILAGASGTTSAGNGQFGQLSYHAIPPNPDQVFEYPTNAFNPWEDLPGSSYGDKDYSHTIFMPSNFEQTGTTPADYLSDTYRVLNFVEQQEPSTEILLYMHWPEPSMLGLNVTGGNQLSRADFRTFNQYTASGDYYNWHVEYQNLIAAQRPAFNVKTIPVGPIIADIVENLGFMQGVEFSDMYVDDAPHGSPTTYFLAAMITYRAMFLDNPSRTYTPTSDIIPEVRNNYSQLIDYIEERMNHYNSITGGLRVY